MTIYDPTMTQNCPKLPHAKKILAILRRAWSNTHAVRRNTKLNERENTMTKSELRDIQNLAVMHKLGMADTVARGLSALIRSARTKRSAEALREYITIFNVGANPHFII
jgi:hypothetical protein